MHNPAARRASLALPPSPAMRAAASTAAAVATSKSIAPTILGMAVTATHSVIGCACFRLKNHPDGRSSISWGDPILPVMTVIDVSRIGPDPGRVELGCWELAVD